MLKATSRFIDGLRPITVNAILGAAGLALIGWGVHIWYEASAFRGAALSAHALVVEIEKKRYIPIDGDLGVRATNVRRLPTLEFRTASGDVVRTDRLKPSRSFVLDQGDRIEILYDPKDPEAVALPGGYGPSAAVLLAIGVGGCLVAGAMIGAVQMRRGY